MHVLWQSLALALWAAGGPAGAGDFARRLEEDWLLQARLRAGPGRAAPGRVSTRQDAAGGVDGVRTGRWGFHTADQAGPWWQVDLGAARKIDRVVVYNRCDGGAGIAARASRLAVLLSADGRSWKQAYRHDGTVFWGASGGPPLTVRLNGAAGRFVRLHLPYRSYFHLDEVEVYPCDSPGKNIALGRPADQSSTSRWSAAHRPGEGGSGEAYPIETTVRRGRLLAADLRGRGVAVGAALAELDAVAAARALPPDAPDAARRALYFRARRAVRRLALANPLLDFDELLVTKRLPAGYSHMSDQYYGWWSRPGGGIYLLSGFREDAPTLRCLTDGFPPGSFLRPDLSADGRRVLFAWCRYYPHLRGLANKVPKADLPEEGFYHLYEMSLDAPGRGGARRLTWGKYDDFDGRYLPRAGGPGPGRIVFLSTRRGQAFQVGRASAAATLAADLPDSYVRCGGGPSRPVAVYTLHTLALDGTDLRAISAFENFEWTPSVAADGRILYARWDYVDRHNNAYISLWSTNPDGTNPQAVYGNFTRAPQCIFEARSIPGSGRILFTASAHHSITGGSLVLLDPDIGTDGPEPLTRLTPEVCFPEIEGWPQCYYANGYPLSEKYYLVCWSPHPLRPQGGANPPDSLGVYLLDAFGNLELLYRDPDISTTFPLPVRPRRPAPAAADTTAPEGEGAMLLVDVYRGLEGVPRGTVRRLRIIGVPAKVQPEMNRPSLGVTREDPGKCVLGTVPVEPDGSAFFRMPAGVNVFFQALDGLGRAVQTMRTVTYVQPGQTLGCVGCHEPRTTSPPPTRPAALRRGPSPITPPPEGAWPVRYERLVQPVLDRYCTRCHAPGGKRQAVAKLDLSPGKSYAALLKAFALDRAVRGRYLAGRSRVNDCIALTSPLCAMFLGDKPHNDIRLDDDARRRLVTWLDTYAQRRGSFSDEQQRRLLELRKRWAGLFVQADPHR